MQRKRKGKGGKGAPSPKTMPTKGPDRALGPRDDAGRLAGAWRRGPVRGRAHGDGHGLACPHALGFAVHLWSRSAPALRHRTVS